MVIHTFKGHNPSPFTLDGTNIYLVGTGRERILIDTGHGLPQFKQDLQTFLQVSLPVSLEITTILLSHHHADHIGGVEDVLELFPKAKVYLGRQESPGNINIHFHYNELSHGQLFKVAGATLQAIYSPGHTRDHFAFLLQESAVLFTGDCILGTGSAVFTNLTDLLSTLSLFRSLHPSRLLCGHGPPVQEAHAKITEYISHRQRREEKIVALLQASSSSHYTESSNTQVDGLSVSEIVARLYPELKEERILKGAQNNVRMHLDKLVSEKVVFMTNGCVDDKFYMHSQQSTDLQDLA